jgi:hypothetical protein
MPFLSPVFKNLIITVTVIVLSTGCAVIDGPGLGERAEGINRSIADYRNVATLLNIIRASNYEPLQFVSISGVTGHNTLNTSISLTRFFPSHGVNSLTVNQNRM